jgi:hypothetical protein
MSEKEKVLTQMVAKFRERHDRLPARIVVAPVALIALGLKQSLTPVWDGIPVECRLFKEEEVASRHEKGDATILGVFAKEQRGRMVLAACDLKG